MALFRKQIFFLLIVFSFLLLGCTIQNNEESNTFTVTFCSGYGDYETTTQTFTANETLTFSTNTFTRENYTFLYWTDYNNDYYEGQQITVTENLYLYAKWQGNYEILSFDFLVENNSKYLSEDVIGNIECSLDNYSSIKLTVPYGTDVTSLISTFTLNDSSVGIVVTVNSVTQISGETPNDFSDFPVIYSLSIPNTDYEMTSYVNVTTEEASTIYFDRNNTLATGSMERLTCGKNNTTKLPKNIFEREGYTFKNWNSSKDGSRDSYEDECEIKVDFFYLQLYAIWIPNTYTVTFVGNGSTGGSMEDQTFTYDVYQSLNENKFTKPGYSFYKWNTSADGSGEGYNNNWKYQNLISEANGKVTLYAIWKESNETSYSVEHYLQNVDCTGYEIQSTDTEEKTGTTGKEASYNNNKYTGFTYDSSLTEVNGVVQSKGTIVAEGTTVVKLFYTRNTVTVNFNLDGGSTTTTLDEASGYDGSLSGKYGATIKIETPTKTGYTFDSWEYDLTTITFPASLKTYTADWTANIYTVTFDGNGGINPSTNLSTYEEDFTYAREYTLGNPFEKTGYEFTGWSLTKDGEIDYTNDATYTTGTENITMYAQWAPLTYTITYYDASNEAYNYDEYFTGTFTENNQPTTHTYGTATELIAPTKNGYYFTGFHLIYNASDNVITTLGATDFTKNILLYATWSSTNIEVTITKADDISIEESTNGTIVTLTAGEGYDSYSWTVDDSIQSGETSNVFNFETSGLVKGYYNIMVTAVKDDLYYSSLVSVYVVEE